jgi:hypothetical protein
VRPPALAGHDRVESGRYLAVVIEAEHLRLRERASQLRAVALGQAARRDHLRAAC